MIPILPFSTPEVGLNARGSVVTARYENSRRFAAGSLTAGRVRTTTKFAMKSERALSSKTKSCGRPHPDACSRIPRIRACFLTPKMGPIWGVPGGVKTAPKKWKTGPNYLTISKLFFATKTPFLTPPGGARKTPPFLAKFFCHHRKQKNFFRGVFIKRLQGTGSSFFIKIFL